MVDGGGKSHYYFLCPFIFKHKFLWFCPFLYVFLPMYKNFTIFNYNFVHYFVWTCADRGQKGSGQPPSEPVPVPVIPETGDPHLQLVGTQSFDPEASQAVKEEIKVEKLSVKLLVFCHCQYKDQKCQIPEGFIQEGRMYLYIGHAVCHSRVYQHLLRDVIHGPYSI